MTINSYTLPDNFKWDLIEPNYDIEDFYDGENWYFRRNKKDVKLEISGDVIESNESLSWAKVKEIVDNCVLTTGFVDIVLLEGTYKGRCIGFYPTGDKNFINIYHIKMIYVLKSEQYES